MVLMYVIIIKYAYNYKYTGTVSNRHSSDLHGVLLLMSKSKDGISTWKSK